MPTNSKITNVSAVFTVLGTRTAFDHSGTLTGTATTEYVPILKYAVGANNRLYLENNAFNLKPTEPMQVESVKAKTLDEQIDYLYKADPASSIEIPRHHNWYASYLYNTGVDDASTNLPLGTTGQYRVDKVWTTAMCNSVLGAPLLDYSYTPKNGVIKPGKRAIAINYSETNGFPSDVTNAQYTNIHAPGVFSVTQTKEQGKVGQLNLSAAAGPINVPFHNRLATDYHQSIDNYVELSLNRGNNGSFINQPQVHIGLIATPALNPATETTNYLNSSVYVLCENAIHIEFNMDSMCADAEEMYSWPEDVRWYMSVKHAYTGYGHQTLGRTATISPRVAGGQNAVFGAGAAVLADELEQLGFVDVTELPPQSMLPGAGARRK